MDDNAHPNLLYNWVPITFYWCISFRYGLTVLDVLCQQEVVVFLNVIG